MNNSRNSTPDFDDRLDAHLRRMSATPSRDFTAATLTRIREMPTVSDDALDRMLATLPAQPRPDFTARTVRLARNRNNILTFVRPMLAAAASVAVCLTGIWTFEMAKAPAETAPAFATAKPSEEPEDIVAMAHILNDAAPLLDAGASDTLAMLLDSRE